MVACQAVTTQRISPKGIIADIHDERHQPLPTNKANEAGVLFRIVVALIFHIRRQGEQVVELGKVNMAPLEDLLPFRFIPSNSHRQRVYNYYIVLQLLPRIRRSRRGFYEILDQVLDLLRQRGRVTYQALQREFNEV